MHMRDNNIIEIDDAGFGSLLGGLMIGVYRRDTNNIWCEYIYETSFQQALTQRRGWKLILEKVLELIHLGLELWGVSPKTHSLFICRGWILDDAARRLSKEGWSIERGKVIGRLQEFVESMFTRELAKIDLELGSYGASTGSNTFFKHLDWVGMDLSNREQYVKTGWDSWNKKWKKRLESKVRSGRYQ